MSEPEQDKPANAGAASTNDGVVHTLIVALVLCVVCSLVVSAAAVGLRPLQEANRALDRQRNILLAAGLYTPERKVADLFDRVESRWVDLSSGRFVETPDGDAVREAQPSTRGTVVQCFWYGNCSKGQCCDATHSGLQLNASKLETTLEPHKVR
jgi:Na+-transporting NADH:ubiquinone oxidoreductase subunit NqrC